MVCRRELFLCTLLYCYVQARDPRRRYSAMPAGNKVKHPTLDIYRPPSEYQSTSTTTSASGRSKSISNCTLQPAFSVASSRAPPASSSSHTVYTTSTTLGPILLNYFNNESRLKPIILYV